jgi:hypothetical protein
MGRGGVIQVTPQMRILVAVEFSAFLKTYIARWAGRAGVL